jgi:molecular chaperone Hsp33
MEKPAFLDRDRPDVPGLVVPGGVTPFYLAGRPVRGRLIRLGVLADAMLTRHDNPDQVTALAGKALALVAALASALKFQGSFSLQIKGDGPVSMLVADCTHDGALRFYARSDEDALNALLAQNPTPTDRELLGNGYLALTVDQGRTWSATKALWKLRAMTCPPWLPITLPPASSMPAGSCWRAK